MRSDRHMNMGHCLLVLAQLKDLDQSGSRGVGNSEIARYTGLTRQAVNSIMKEAERSGYCKINHIVWRENDGQGNPVFAKRYEVTPFWAKTYRGFWAALYRNGVHKNAK